jgi:hypothetical protein
LSFRIAEIVAKLSGPQNDSSSKKSSGKNKKSQLELTAEVQAMVAEFLAGRGQLAVDK